MMTRPSLSDWLTRASRWILRALLVFTATALALIQALELSGNGEILPITFFVVLVSFSALSFSWYRAADTQTRGDAPVRLYRSGVRFFGAALLAMIAMGFAFQPPGVTLAGWALNLMLGFHWLTLVSALVLALVAFFGLVDELLEPGL